MAEDKSQDIFIANTIYPDVEGLFAFSPKSLAELKKDALVVLDTNTLLLPYSIGPNSIKEIKQTYQKLARQKRLFIPGQVVREFAKNRTLKIAELYQQFNRKKAPKYLNQGQYPLLEGIEEYQEVLKLEHALFELEKKHSQAINKVLERIRGWGWNDPVSLIYHDLFSKGVVYDPEFDRAEITRDLARRQIYKLPPGYKDAAKDDQGIGDLLIWYTILDLAKKQKKNVLFVSADQKPDWWCQSEGQPLYPRYELIDEYRRISEGQTIGITKFSEFVSLFGADETVVEEVRKEEYQLQAYSDIQKIDHPKFNSLAEKAVLQWLTRQYGENAIRINNDRKIPCDFVLIKSETEQVAIEIQTSTRKFTLSKVKDLGMQAFYTINKGGFAEYILVMVLLDYSENIPGYRVSQLRSIAGHIDVPNFSLILGFIKDNQFVPIDENHSEDFPVHNTF